MKKAIKYAVAFLFLLQAMLPYLLPLEPLYDYRVREDKFAQDSRNYHALLDRLKVEIDDNRIRDYIVILGDSVAYGSAVQPEESVGYYMEQLRVKEGGYGKPAIFNLAQPGMQAGDMYAMLLLLDRYGISTDRVVLNVRYDDFAPRRPGPAIAALLPDTLHDLDRDSYAHLEPQLASNGHHTPGNRLGQSLAYARDQIAASVSLIRYKDVLAEQASLAYERYFESRAQAYSEQEQSVPAEADVPAEVPSTLSRETFDLTDASPQVYMLEKIMEHQKGKETLVFLAGINETAHAEELADTRVRDNLQRINGYFADKPVKYLNLQGRLTDEYYADDVLYNANGYRAIAAMLWEEMRQTKDE
ncbi:hypothetical protein J31TS4_43340 [Paenibacillus sp. J31TS4]|uniref:hypothetical protein n=1 Tax=Paenibacillus sp. J31TS4 TaxID=2807195 RepID=UPI001B2BBC53|nr:hypothetical protein [Paenibacillus sp. J31TS4]GIP41054.1 hypothetical protein J31TS4_43340 [Paenibacillus sp. J31TS4]